MTTLLGHETSEPAPDVPLLLPLAASRLMERIAARDAVVAVIGLGYVGLPLALAFAENGFRVVGVDIDAERVARLNTGNSPVPDVPSEELAPLVAPITVVHGDRAERWAANGNGHNGNGHTGNSHNTNGHNTNGHNTNGNGHNGNGHNTRPKGSMSFTTDYSVLAVVDAVIICVPTPITKSKDPDVSYIEAATDEISKHLHEGMVVVLESTTYPGTTEEIILPMLEQPGKLRRRRLADASKYIERSPLVVGQDFFLAFSPERIDPGRVDYTVRTTPKVIGGTTPVCLQVATELYESAIDTIVPVSLPKTAEMVKLLENTFRALNIALVNELAIMCDHLDIDVWEVISAASSKPFGYMPFYPGPGLGGHCIPVDPHYLEWKLRTLDYNARTIQLAAEINRAMPEYVMTKISRALNQRGRAVKGSRVLVIGVAYKADVTDVRESPALELIELLLEQGADVVYHDDYVPSLSVTDVRLKSLDLHPEELENADLVVIETAHSGIDWHAVGRHSKVIVDTRNIMATVDNPRARVVKL
jgi:UDP-N-acetyl-D-glucosamine dehydrogenase